MGTLKKSHGKSEIHLLSHVFTFEQNSSCLTKFLTLQVKSSHQ